MTNRRDRSPTEFLMQQLLNWKQGYDSMHYEWSYQFQERVNEVERIFDALVK